MNEGIEDLLAENKSARGGRGEIILPNGRLAALWIHELYGQLSDGAWENHWFDHPDSWEDYHRLGVSVDTDRDVPVIEGSEITGDIPDFLAPRPRRNEDLVDVIGDRMVEYVQQYGYEDYDKEGVREDLRLLNETERR